MSKFLTNVNLAQNELQNAKVQNLASAPSSPVAGQVYYDTTLNQFGYYNGSTWIYAGSVSYGSVTAQTSFGAASGNGSATTLSRSDHTHGTPTHLDADHSAIHLNALATATGNYNMGSNKITNALDPTSAQDYATKIYVDSVAQGLTWKPAANYATTTALTGTFVYAAVGTGVNLGVGDTLTAPSNGASLTVDGQSTWWTAISQTISTSTVSSSTITANVTSTAGMAVGQYVTVAGTTGFTTNNASANGTFAVNSIPNATSFTYIVNGAAPTGSGTGGTAVSVGTRLLVKNEATTANNGMYVCTQVGTASSKFIFTRATDMDSATAIDTNLPKYDGAAIYVESGTTNATSSWTCTNTGVVTPGTTSITFSQLAGPGTVTAGTGITVTGNQVAISNSYVGQTSITTVGTISAGTWNGTNIAVANGGTGSGTASGARTNLSATAQPLPSKAIATIGDGSSTSIAVTDGLGTIDKIAEIRDASTNIKVECDITYSATQTTFAFAVAPASNAYKVVIVG